MKRHGFRSILCQLGLLLCLTNPANALIDPAIDWQVLETDHFEIIFDSRDLDLAKRYALYSEGAYSDLLPLFKEAPQKTVVWLNNLTDISNGSATAIPYPTIVAYPVAPSIEQTVGHYTHWGRELMTHEYAHILQFEPVHGIMRPLKILFGTIVAPNGLLPRWWLEGMAVEIESQFSTGGRLRSHRQQALLRTLALEEALQKEDISRVNEVSIPDWLGGRRPYLFGSVIWAELVSQYGNDAIYGLNQSYSRRIPFLINGPAQKMTGQTYSDFLKGIYEKIHRKALAQSEIIKSKGVLPSRRLVTRPTDQTRGVLRPRHNEYTFIEAGEDFSAKIISVPLQEIVKKESSSSQNIIDKIPFPHGPEKTGHLVDGASASRLSWNAEGTKLVYDKISSYKRYYNFSDLYVFDAKTEKSLQITYGQRLREPAFSVDGKKIIFVQTLGAEMKLGLIDADGKNQKIIYIGKNGMRLSHPEFITEDKILFSARNRNGKEQLKLFDLKEKKVFKVLNDYEPAYHPRRISQGFLFTSERTGVANIYHSDLDLKKVRPLTNSVTFADYGAYDEKNGRLFYSEMHADGFKIFTVDSPIEKIKTTPPKIEKVISYKRQPYKKNKLKVTAKEKDYSALKYMVPRYWIPSATVSQDGWFLAAETGSTDPIGTHSYALLAGYDTGTEKLNTVFNYRNQTTAVPITLGVADIYDFFGSVVRQQTSVSLNGAGYYGFLSDAWTWGAGWDYAQTTFFDDHFIRQGPRLYTRYINVTRRGKQLAPENGGDFLFSITHYIESLGNVGFTSFQANGSYYLSKWLPKRHVFATKLRGLWAPDNQDLEIGSSTAAGTYQSVLISNQLLMRGYLSGNFIAQNALNASFEYVMPLFYQYQGYDTLPLFSKNWHLRFIADVITLDGLFFDSSAPAFRGADFGDVFTGVGGELHWNVTLGYHMPFNMFVGLYYGLDDEASGGFNTFLGLSL